MTNCVEEKVSSYSAPSLMRTRAIIWDYSSQVLYGVDFEGIFTKGVFHSSKEHFASASLSHYVENSYGTFDVSLSSVDDDMFL